MKNTRLLWLTENYPPQRGGMSQSCDRIVNGLRKEGFIIDVIHFVDHDSLIKKRSQINGTYTSIACEQNESHILNLAWASLKKQPRPDYLVSFGSYLAMIGSAVYANWLDVPLVTLIRGNDFDSSIFTPRKRKVLDDCIKTSAKVCTVTTEKQWKLRKLYPKSDIIYTPNGISLHEWRPQPSEYAFAQKYRTEMVRDKICFGLFGDLKPKKGIDFFCRSLWKAGWIDRIHFLMIGDVENKLLEQLQNKNISFTHIAFLDRYELLKYYLCTDAVVIPSFYDGMPNVLLEAGALGIPVIGSAVDGIADVIENENLGRLFEPLNEDDIRRVIFEFIDLDDVERSKLGKDLKQHIIRNFNDENEIGRYGKVFS